MLDPFTERETFLCGAVLPDSCEFRALIEHHQQRLATFARLREAAAKCGIATDPEHHLLVIPEDEISLLKSDDGAWGRLYAEIESIRKYLPLLSLKQFGFPADVEEPLDENYAGLRKIGVGMEVWAFQDDQHGSIYKFFLPRPPKWAGAIFRFSINADRIHAVNSFDSTYRELMEKILLLNLIKGMPTEIAGITPEGVLVVKQTRGQTLPHGTDPTPLLDSQQLFNCPARFLDCDRVHPRLTYANDQLWLIGDLHARNIAYDESGSPRIIDFVAAQIPLELIASLPLMRDWLDRVRLDPNASLLGDAQDHEL